MVRTLRPGEGLDGALSAGRLGPGGVVFFVMAAAAPLTVVAGTLATAYSVTGDLGLPAAFAALGLLLAVFAVGYVAMSRRLPHAGAFYAYVTAGLGRPAGVGAAWVSLLAYHAIQCCLYGAIGAAVSPLVHDHLGLDLAWWVYALTAWALVAVLGVGRVEVSGRVLAVLLVCEIVLILGYDAAWLAHPAHGLAWSTWSPGELAGPGAGAVLAIGVLGFTGFETTVVFAEEAKNPRRTVPTATYIAIAVITVLYGVSAWAMTVAAGPDQIVPAARSEGTDLVFQLAGAHSGAGAVTAGRILFATSILAAMISFHATCARYAFALGREGVLPGTLGRTSPTGSPRAGSLVQSGVGLLVILAVAVTGADPVVDLFYTFSVAGAVGILILLLATALAVLGYFGPTRRHLDAAYGVGDEGDPEGVWATRVAPMTATLGLAAVLALVLANMAGLLGVTQSSPLCWGIPVAYAVTAVAGIGYGLVLSRLRPEVYAVIGHGAKAALHPAPATVAATTTRTTRGTTGPGLAALLPNAPLPDARPNAPLPNGPLSLSESWDGDL